MSFVPIVFGLDAPDPPLFGIWNVHQLSVDGQVSFASAQ
jgi:hypothetical protein